MNHYAARRSRHNNSYLRPLVAFLLIASVGILFAGCAPKVEQPAGGGPAHIPQADKFTFTAEDLARMKEMMQQQPMMGVPAESGSGLPYLVPMPPEEGSGAAQIPVLDVRTKAKFIAVRSSGEQGKDVYRVTNAFVNVRSAPKITAAQVARFNQGDSVDVVEFVDAAWAKIKVAGGKDGYVSSRYISKIVSETELAAEKKKYDGLYFVDFGFVNVRKAADTASEKIGDLPGQAFVRPLSMDKVWARVPYQSSNGYVAVQYLSPFLPNFLVREDSFTLPVVQYRLEGKGVLDHLPQHIAKLQQEGYTFRTVRDFAELLLKQEERDVRITPKTVIIAIAGVTPENYKEVSDDLRSSGVPATLFFETKYIGKGIDQKQIQTLQANGMDIESGGHTGDDLRSLTNAQVQLELAQSRQLIEEATKKPVYAIAYPIGGVNDRVAGLAADAGYLMGLSTAQGITFKRGSLLQMPTIIVTASTGAEELLKEVQGK